MREGCDSPCESHAAHEIRIMHNENDVREVKTDQKYLLKSLNEINNNLVKLIPVIEVIKGDTAQNGEDIKEIRAFMNRIKGIGAAVAIASGIIGAAIVKLVSF